MSISHAWEKIKDLLRQCEKMEAYTSFIIVLVGVSSFFLGRISLSETTRLPVAIDTVNMPKKPVIEAPATSTPSGSKGKYVASKTGQKYHLPTCAGAKSIPEANRIWFQTKEEAEKAGYTPAGNCKGI